MTTSSHDGELKQYACRLCDLTFPQPQALAIHEKHHNNKFPCNYCPRRMKTEREFLRHEATHAESSVINHKQKKAVKKKQSQPPDKVNKLINSNTSNDSTKTPEKVDNLNFNARRKYQQSDPDLVSTTNEVGIFNAVDRANSYASTKDIEGNRESSREVSPKYLSDVFSKAALYDDLSEKCDKMAREIELLKAQHGLSDSDDDNEDSMEIPLEKNQHLTSKNGDGDIRWENGSMTVPLGWNMGKSKFEGKTYFRSPEGFIFNSRVKVLEFLINGNFPDEMLQTVKRYLYEEGWVADDLCPVGWMSRSLSSSKGVTEYEFLSPAMEVICSTSDMLRYMNSSVNFGSREIERLERKMKGITRDVEELDRVTDVPSGKPISANSISSTLEREYLPSGWSKEEYGGSSVYVSPDGSKFHTIEQVLAEIRRQGLHYTGRHSPTTTSIGLKRKCEDEWPPVKKGKPESLSRGKNKEDSRMSDVVSTLELYRRQAMFPDDSTIDEINASTNLSRVEVMTWFMKRGVEQAKGEIRNWNSKVAGTKPRTIDRFSDVKLSEMQVNALNEEFNSKHNPTTTQQYQMIAERLMLDEKTVYEWFEQRRRSLYDRNLLTSEFNNIITDDQESALQSVLSRTSKPSEADLKNLISMTGLSRLNIERWFNFQI